MRSAEAFIAAALERGEACGVSALTADERLVYLISEAEVWCDMEGIDSFLGRYSSAEVAECAAAFREVGAAGIAAALEEIAETGGDPRLLDRANALVTARTGYDYASIRRAVGRRRGGVGTAGGRSWGVRPNHRDSDR